MRRIKISYDKLFFPENPIDDNDYREDNGWVDEEGIPIAPDEYDIDEHGSELAAIVESVVDVIGLYVEPSSCPTWVQGTWYLDCDGTRCQFDGSETRQSYHLDGFREEEEREIYRRLTGRSNATRPRRDH